VRAEATLLTGYLDATHQQTLRYLAALTDDDLDRVVDEEWDPPVTLGVRLVSVVDDDLEHVGQAAFLGRPGAEVGRAPTGSGGIGSRRSRGVRMVPEQVVLVDDAGQPVGVADKATVHGPTTPRHLAFSCYGFDGAGRVLVTQRAAEKRAFPWCGRAAAAATRRRGRTRPPRCTGGCARSWAPPSATCGSCCPTSPTAPPTRRGSRSTSCARCSSARSTATRGPIPAEVAAWEWWPWDRFLDEAARGALSPWAALQAPLLAAAADPLTAARVEPFGRQNWVFGTQPGRRVSRRRRTAT
jgi:isopentenyl-diphosphate delta-isomerase